MTSPVRPRTCSACPYRRDVPSGIWAEHEYAKLETYDQPLLNQPLAPFACHATPTHLCARTMPQNKSATIVIKARKDGQRFWVLQTDGQSEPVAKSTTLYAARRSAIRGAQRFAAYLGIPVVIGV